MARKPCLVVAGLALAIQGHPAREFGAGSNWMPGSSPGMTVGGCCRGRKGIVSPSGMFRAVIVCGGGMSKNVRKEEGKLLPAKAS